MYHLKATTKNHVLHQISEIGTYSPRNGLMVVCALIQIYISIYVYSSTYMWEMRNA
jgi:hypothetical protein